MVAEKHMAFEYAVVLTGSIGTGKSTVLKVFTSFGFDTIDADNVAHQVLQEQAEKIASMFGTAVVREGVVDRKALGEIVFSDSNKRKDLESLLHPLIYEEIERLSRYQASVSSSTPRSYVLTYIVSPSTLQIFTLQLYL